jgi:thiol-disulfide isomerase/thioredoxin
VGAASRMSRRSAVAAVVATAVVVLLMPIISVVAIAQIATRPAARPVTHPSREPAPTLGSGGERSENAQSDQATTRRATAITEIFSTFRATDIEGRELTASSLRGRVVVLDFWATWCAPCLAEVPTYQKLRRDYDASRLEIIGVSVDVLDRRGLMSWLRRQQVTWTQVHDRRGYSGELAQQFKVVMLPTTYVFDGEGKMVAANVRGEQLIQTVAELIPRPAR